MRLIPLLLLTIACSGCGLVFGLFYKDWTSKLAYKSTGSKQNYYTITGVTQSHCGCSDLVGKNYSSKEQDFTIYYGGGLFPAEKYVYLRSENRIDTIVYRLVTTESFEVPFSDRDSEILHKMDSLAQIKSANLGIVYEVKRNVYTGMVRRK